MLIPFYDIPQEKEITPPKTAFCYFSKKKYLKSSILDSNFFAIAIKIQKKDKDRSYNELPGSDRVSIEKTRQLFHALCDKSLTDLFKNRDKYEKLGDEISSSHPLQFLGAIFSDQTLRPKLHRISANPVKKWNVFKKLHANIKHDIAKKNFFKYLDEFSKEINVPTTILKSFFCDKAIKNKDIDKFIEYLFKNV